MSADIAKTLARVNEHLTLARIFSEETPAGMVGPNTHAANREITAAQALVLDLVREITAGEVSPISAEDMVGKRNVRSADWPWSIDLRSAL